VVWPQATRILKKKMEATFSVAIANYNHGRFLGAALEDVLHHCQHVVPKEILVIDDCSTDDSSRIIEALAAEHPEITIIRNPRNRGCLGVALQIQELASGDYVSPTGADDPWLPGFHDKTIPLLRQYPQAGLCCTDYTRIFPDGTASKVGIALSEAPCYLSPKELAGILNKRPRLSLTTNTAVFKKAAYLEAGGFRPELKWHHDWFIAWVIAFRHGICYIPESLQLVHVSPNSYSQAGMRDREAQRGVIKALLELLEADEHADVRHYFKIPAVLSKFGLKLLELLVKEPRYWHYLSLPLIQFAIQYGEGVEYELGEDLARPVGKEEAASICRHHLKILRNRFMAEGERLRLQGNLVAAAHFYERALDTDNDFEEARECFEECLQRRTSIS